MLALALVHGRVATEIALVPAGAGLGFSLPSRTFLLLDALPAERAGLAGGLFNASRQTGGAIAVGLLARWCPGRPAHSGRPGSFAGGMRVSLLLAAALLAASTAAAFTVLRRDGGTAPRRHGATGPRGRGVTGSPGPGNAGPRATGTPLNQTFGTHDHGNSCPDGNFLPDLGRKFPS